MAFAKFQENRYRIHGENAENHAILVNLTASIEGSRPPLRSRLERSMYLNRKILTSSKMVKMAELFFGRCFKNALT